MTSRETTPVTRDGRRSTTPVTTDGRRSTTPAAGDDGLYEIAMDIHASDASQDEFPDVDAEGFSLEQQIER